MMRAATSQEAIRAIKAIENVQQGLHAADAPASWRLSAFSGRFGEISGGHACASLTLAFRLVLEAQQLEEPVAWISGNESVFFPPDAAEAGVDLDILVVILASETLQVARAADHLLRSGAFGLVVMDLGTRSHLPLHAQTRLIGLSNKHDTALVCLTEKESDRPSISPLISLRAQAVRTRRLGDRYRCEARIIKDKRRGPGWTHAEICRAPDGLH